MGESRPQRLIHTFGRRRGRRLRSGQQALLTDLLPRTAVTSPPPAPADLFSPPPREVWLEIGFGGGEHLAAQAASHPQVGFIGCEPFVNGVVALLAQVKAQALGNVRIWQGDARALLAGLPAASIGRAFILFPDPWPKARHHKRRLVTAGFLDGLARILVHGAELRLATDDRDYLVWMLERLTAHPAFAWTARGPGDWRRRPADWPATRYEAKALAAGRQPAYLRFARTAAAASGCAASRDSG